MIPGLLTVGLGACDDNQVGLRILGPWELDLDVKLIHDLADGASARADEPRVHSTVHRHFHSGLSTLRQSQTRCNNRRQLMNLSK